ncbi:MAG: hypothetical protein PUF01_02685 [Eubacteriales bacterium]|nr:hypothetical protein [Eubacteriales bacterium]
MLNIVICDDNKTYLQAAVSVIQIFSTKEKKTCTFSNLPMSTR